MERKLERVLDMLRAGAPVSSATLREELGISERTVRSYISRINERLAETARIEQRRGKGYVLVVEDAEAFGRAVESGRRRSHDVPQTPAERVRFIASILLNRTDWITVEALSESLYVSRFTVSDDLREVDRLLGRYGITLERRSHRGIRAVGSEFGRRTCLAGIAIDAFVDASGPAAQDSMRVTDMRDAVARVARHVSDVTAAHDLRINPVAYQNLLVHIAIAVMRTSENHSVPMGEDQLRAIEATEVYPAARELARAVGDEFGMEFPPEEVAYIAVHLSGKQSIYDAMALGAEKDVRGVVPPEAWDVASEMIRRVEECFGFDLSDDFELRMNLATHVAPLSVRLRYGMQMKNPLLTDIRQRFAVAYSMAQEASAVLAARYGRAPSEDEVGYIALAFALSLERLKGSERGRRNILVVCASGAGSARLLEFRFRSVFGDRLGRIETCDAQSVGSFDLTDIDCVFTTVPLSVTLPVPVFSIGAFLDDAELPRVRAALEAEPSSGALGRFFDRRLFFPHCRFSGKEDAISFLCARVREVRDADEDVEELVWQREEMAITSFGNRVAMPHPSRPVVDESVVAVALLDDPVDWGGKDVLAVFLVCISRNRDKGLQPLYRSLAGLMGSESEINELISRQSFDALLELLQRQNLQPRRGGRQHG